MFRYVKDQLGRFFPVLLIPMGLGILLAVVASTGSAAFFVGIGLTALVLLMLCYQTFAMLGNLMNCKKAGMLDAFLADYQKAKFVANGLRMGEHFLFWDTVYVQYSDVRSLHASITKEHNHNGGVLVYYDLNAGVAGGTTMTILRLSPRDSLSPSDVNLTFTRVMNDIAAKNPNVRITPPKF